jgi:hypothetical protein
MTNLFGEFGEDLLFGGGEGIPSALFGGTRSSNVKTAWASFDRPYQCGYSFWFWKIYLGIDAGKSGFKIGL